MFTTQPGKILKTEIREIGTVGNIVVAKLKTTDVGSQSSIYAIRIDDNYFNSIITPATLYIDIEELDSVITAMTYFMEEANRLKPDVSLHLSYITKADIAVSCDYTKWSENGRFSIGRIYKVLRSAVPNTSISFNRRRVPELIALLNKSKSIGL
jgi:hypothetical protein